MSGWNFDNTYARLPASFFAKLNPEPVRAPKMAVFNPELAAALGLNAHSLNSEEGVKIFSGNAIPEGSEPIAQAYAGHQFGHFNTLGDGRAILLGEHLAPSGERFDIQLKGSGQTPFSRRGDGRAGLGPMLREFIISEAMHALGIPTTRSLAVVSTGEVVFRERPQPGAILTRVASSHIRVGTFEYFAASENGVHIRALADYTLKRHFPSLVGQPEPYLAMLRELMESQASLVSHWLRVGFIHGVMNTDNMAVSGETIDYGPCAFINEYEPATVFSSIDSNGRYAFANQAPIAGWNIARFAEALLPLLDPVEEKAVAKAEEAMKEFSGVFKRHYMKGMRAKLGLRDEMSDDLALLEELLHLMKQHQADYTNSFRALSLPSLPAEPLFQDPAFQLWHTRWKARSPSLELLRASCPAVIPRNHRVEEALEAAVEKDDFTVMHRLLQALRAPYEDLPEFKEYRVAPAPGTPYQTFCGT